MREQRQQAVAATQMQRIGLVVAEGQQLPWQYWATIHVPSFLQHLPLWQVVLCTTHEACFAQDTLSDHLIHHHGAIEDEADNATNLFPNDSLARTWEDVVHPTSQITAIPGLPVIKGYSCSEPVCSYRTVKMGDLFTHSQETRHQNLQTEECLFQTLSSNPTEV